MFRFSLIVVKKLLKALALFLGSFNISSFTSKVGTSSTKCTFSVSFFVKFHLVLFVIRFCCKTTVVLLLI
jgi:hypothetical protein